MKFQSGIFFDMQIQAIGQKSKNKHKTTSPQEEHGILNLKKLCAKSAGSARSAGNNKHKNNPECVIITDYLQNYKPCFCLTLAQPKKIHLTDMKSKLFLAATCLLFANAASALNPSKEYATKPEKYGMTYKEEKVPTKDGASLNAWFFETAKKTTNWVIISGSGDGNMADNIEIASQFLSAGWNVAMYDYRGYGSSSDFAIDPETYIYPQFIADLNGVADYLRKSRAITKFDLYGTNIGAGLSLGVGCNRTETRKIIADGSWTGLELMKKKFKDVLAKNVVIPFGYDKNYEPMYACDRSRPTIKGVMLIVSAKDSMINPNDMKLLKCQTTMYIVANSPSNAENFNTDKNVYFEKVNKFLNQ